MTHSYPTLREQFEEMIWALAKRQPLPTELDGVPMIAPLDLCGKLWNSTDTVPSGEPFKTIERMLEKIDVDPKRNTYGVYARGVKKLLMTGVKVAA